jgi:hypothetical protein
MLERDPEMLQEANRRRIATATGGSVCVLFLFVFLWQAVQSSVGTPQPTPEVCLLNLMSF